MVPQLLQAVITRDNTAELGQVWLKYYEVYIVKDTNKKHDTCIWRIRYM